MKTLRQTTLILLSIVFFTACSNDDSNDILSQKNETQQNIVQVAQSTPELSILVEAASKTGLVDALSQGNQTVLAPTNEAFMNFLDANNFNSLDDVPNELLKNVLLNHVISGEIPSSTLMTLGSGYTKTMATGPNDENLSLYFSADGDVTFNGMSSVLKADIDATNGVVHVIDEVIGLPTIATFATSNPNLSILVDALAYADTGAPTVPYITTVSDNEAGPLTVFAPTNGAFVNLLDELNINALTDLSTDTVDAVLLTHIVNANVQSDELTSGNVGTLGGDITVDTNDFTITDPENRETNIITSLVDIQGINGVVHVIDRVILPNMN